MATSMDGEDITTSAVTSAERAAGAAASASLEVTEAEAIRVAGRLGLAALAAARHPRRRRAAPRASPRPSAPTG